MIILRDYQQSAINGIRSAIREGHKKVMLMIPTGGGKTRIAAAIIESALAKGKKVLFVADLRTLVDQSAIEFGKLGIDGSVVMADDPRYAPWKGLQVCSAQTLMRRTQPDADLVIIDEAHTHYEYLTELMKVWSLVPFIGLSASPFTRGLGNHYTKLVQGPTTSELMDMGYLLKPICYGPPTIDTSKLRMNGNDYDQKQLGDAVKAPQITADIVNTYLDKGEGRKFILFPVNVAHSKDMVNAFNLAGVPCAHIDAHTPDEERQVYYEQLNTGELVGLSSVGVLSKGFDETSVSCVILGFATKSLMKYIQTVGRGLRAHEGQDNCIVLDHGGNVERLGFPDDPLPDFLCNGDETEAARQKEREKEKEEKELSPKKCPSCHHLVDADKFICSDCGHIFAKKSEVEVINEDLQKLERTPAQKRNRTTSKEVKQDFFSSALGYCYAKGYKEGWASNKYREYFGVWPNKMAKVCGSGSVEFDNFMKYQRIKWAKGHKVS